MTYTQTITLTDSGEVKFDGTRINHFPVHLPSGITIKKMNSESVCVV